MAVTTTYSIELITNIDLDFATGAPDATTLANGGFSGIGNHTTHIDGTIFDANQNRTDGFTSLTGSNGAMDQLANGNLVIVSEDGGVTKFKVVDSVTGDTVIDTSGTGDVDDGLDPDVAALAGGRFVIVTENNFGDPEFDIQVNVFDTSATSIAQFGVDTSSSNDTNAAVAALDNGNFAVTWQRDNGANTEIWYALYDADGGELVGPALVDNAGSINRNADIVATNGGFAIVYEDNGWGTGSVDITLARFDEDGVFGGYTNVNNPSSLADSSDDATPTITRISNGMLAVGWSYNAFPDGDSFVTLLDASGATVLTPYTSARVVTGGEAFDDDVEDLAIAGFGNGRIAAFHTNVTDGDVDGEALQAVRTSLGDGADDVITGDDIRDIMNGNGGNDQLDGAGGNDQLTGGFGNDSIKGGGGIDALNGNEDNDTLKGGGGADYIIGGDGIDTVSYNDFGATLGVIVNLATNTGSGGNAAGDTILNIENVIGTNFVDTLTGDGNANVLTGSLGNDTLNGGGGADTLDGGGDADAMAGGAQNDTYSIDNVGDTVSELFNEGYDTVNTTLASHILGANVERVNSNGSANFVGTGNALANRFQSLGGDDRFVDVLGGGDIFSGGAGTDTVDFRTSGAGAVLNFGTNVHGGAAAGDSYSSIEKFLGSNTAGDTMTGGGTGRWVFVGGGGNDVLTGGIKNDQLLGQGGNDTLVGGADRDSLQGGADNDTMTGGAAGDVFVYSNLDAVFGEDTITDYQDGLDSFKIHSAVANDISDFFVSGNGTSTVTLTLAAGPTNIITINGPGAIFIDNADFTFY